MREVVPSILQPTGLCNAGKTARSRVVPEAVQTVTQAVPIPSQTLAICPTKITQGLDLPDLHGSGPTFALRL